MRAHLCLTLCDPMDCSPPGSSVHGIFQARILSGLPFPRGSSGPRDWTHITCIPCIGRRVLYHYITWEAPRTIATDRNMGFVPVGSENRPQLNLMAKQGWMSGAESRANQEWAIRSHCYGWSSLKTQHFWVCILAKSLAWRIRGWNLSLFSQLCSLVKSLNLFKLYFQHQTEGHWSCLAQ